jgi:hypothetical protein
MRHGTRSFILLAAALLVSACASRSSTSTRVEGTPVLTQIPAPAPASAAYDPAGKWSLALVAQGQAMELTMTLVRNADGTYGGNFTSEVLPPMVITSAKLDGTRMVITLPVPTGDVATMNMTFAGDVLEGDWSMPGDGSKLSGKRI